MTQSLGRVSIMLRGAYSNDEQYNRLDVVSFEGSSYCALETTQGIDPTNESYWQKIAERGGEGPQGEVGPIGPDGNGIISIDKISTSGAVDTYRVSMQNGDFYDFEVTNGDGSDWTDVRNKPFNTVDTNVFSVIAGMLTVNTDAFATKSDPNFTGFLSLNRKGGVENPAGPSSVAIGSNCVASAYAAIAVGYETKSSGRGGYSEGYRTKSSGAEGNHAEGYESEAAGPYQAAHAEGYKSKASGNASHSEGYETNASGLYSHSEGLGTIANGRSQHVQGSYNVPDTNNKYLHIVGNGTDDLSRSNAHTIDKNGNAWFAGVVEDGAGNKLSLVSKIEPIETKVDSIIETLDGIGTEVKATVTDFSIPSKEYTSICNIELTQGIWFIASRTTVPAGNVQDVRVILSNSASGTSAINNSTAYERNDFNGTHLSAINLTNYYVVNEATATIYLKIYQGNSAAVDKFEGRLSAIKIG